MKLFYFGGYQSTRDNVMAWKKSLEGKCDVEVVPFHYPDGASAGNPFSRWGDSQTDYVLSEMAEQGNVLVGHSSGAAIANYVAGRAVRIGKQFRLISLDGQTPSTMLMALPDTLRWSAVGAGGERSLNYEGDRPPHYQVFHAKVHKRWPLHFSLVNLNVSDDYSAIEQGYHNCDANHIVLRIDMRQITNVKDDEA